MISNPAGLIFWVKLSRSCHLGEVHEYVEKIHNVSCKPEDKNIRVCYIPPLTRLLKLTLLLRWAGGMTSYIRNRTGQCWDDSSQ